MEAWVYDNVKRFSAFPAVAGYYSCDDCCHVVRGKFAGAEYTAIASIHDHIFTKLDPYRLMFGTIACGEVRWRAPVLSVCFTPPFLKASPLYLNFSAIIHLRHSL